MTHDETKLPENFVITDEFLADWKELSDLLCKWGESLGREPSKEEIQAYLAGMRVMGKFCKRKEIERRSRKGFFKRLFNL